MKAVFRNNDARLIKSQGAKRRLRVDFDPLVSTSDHVKSRKEDPIPSESSKTNEEPVKPLQLDSIDERFTFPSHLVTTSRVVEADVPPSIQKSAADRLKDHQKQWSR